jgi:ATP/maltotriose-dependent transcriptional regulator MalT
MEVRLFGELEAVAGGVPVPVRGAKQRALLALLALQRGQPVSADRLSERLDRGTASKLTLVSAPAGFGKTTLLAEWLTAGPGGPTRPAGERLVAWLSLDRPDNDPASFWTYVIAARAGTTAAPSRP